MEVEKEIWSEQETTVSWRQFSLNFNFHHLFTISMFNHEVNGELDPKLVEKFSSGNTPDSLSSGRVWTIDFEEENSRVTVD